MGLIHCNGCVICDAVFTYQLALWYALDKTQYCERAFTDSHTSNFGQLHCLVYYDNYNDIIIIYKYLIYVLIASRTNMSIKINDHVWSTWSTWAPAGSVKQGHLTPWLGKFSFFDHINKRKFWFWPTHTAKFFDFDPLWTIKITFDPSWKKFCGRPCWSIITYRNYVTASVYTPVVYYKQLAGAGCRKNLVNKVNRFQEHKA